MIPLSQTPQVRNCTRVAQAPAIPTQNYHLSRQSWLPGPADKKYCTVTFLSLSAFDSSSLLRFFSLCTSMSSGSVWVKMGTVCVGLGQVGFGSDTKWIGSGVFLVFTVCWFK
ncbi:hypothetical protein QL285_063108 [Trifolium repens]|nr:hypothetical protein QL285_063108 [Trifolium repens]